MLEKQREIDDLLKMAAEALSDFVSEELGPIVEQAAAVLLGINLNSSTWADDEREELLFYSTYHNIFVKLLARLIDEQFVPAV